MWKPQTKEEALASRAGEGATVLVPGTDGGWYAFSPEVWAAWLQWAALGGSRPNKPRWSAKKRREERRDGLLWK